MVSNEALLMSSALAAPVGVASTPMVVSTLARMAVLRMYRAMGAYS